MELGWLIGLIIGAAMGAALVWLWLRNKTDDVKVEALAEQIKQFEAEAKVSAGKLAVAEERELHLNKSVDEWRKQATAFMEQLNQSEKQLANLKQQYALKEQAYETLQAAAEKEQKQLLELQKQFKDQFENLSHAILRQQTDQFNTLSKESLSVLINPFKDKLDTFEKTVRESYDTENKERASLKGQIEQLVTLNQRMALEAQNLTQALKGDSKVQGDWGEAVLERLFEAVGMQAGKHYLKQENIKGEDGSNQRPDFIVLLPGDKHIIVDSKVSLTAYERYASAADEVIKKSALSDHIASIRRHIQGLETRQYQSQLKTAADFVVLYLPIEPAWMLALQNDNALHVDAVKKRVLLASTTSLFATLRIVMQMWGQQTINEKALEMATEAGKLYDKFVGFTEDMEKVGDQLKTLTKTYDGAMNKLTTGSGNLIKRAETLRKLGAKTTKQLPTALIKETEEDGEENN